MPPKKRPITEENPDLSGVTPVRRSARLKSRPTPEETEEARQNRLERKKGELQKWSQRIPPSPLPDAEELRRRRLFFLTWDPPFDPFRLEEEAKNNMTREENESALRKRRLAAELERAKQEKLREESLRTPDSYISSGSSCGEDEPEQEVRRIHMEKNGSFPDPTLKNGLDPNCSSTRPEPMPTPKEIEEAKQNQLEREKGPRNPIPKSPGIPDSYKNFQL